MNNARRCGPTTSFPPRDNADRATHGRASGLPNDITPRQQSPFGARLRCDFFEIRPPVACSTIQNNHKSAGRSVHARTRRAAPRSLLLSRAACDVRYRAPTHGPRDPLPRRPKSAGSSCDVEPAPQPAQVSGGTASAGPRRRRLRAGTFRDPQVAGKKYSNPAIFRTASFTNDIIRARRVIRRFGSCRWVKLYGRLQGSRVPGRA